MIAASPVGLLPGAAHAQEEWCAEPLDHAGWLEGMNAADAALAKFEPDKAKRILYDLKKRVPCLDEIARPSYIGRYARQMALVAFFEQDEITAIRWGMLQRYAAPDLPWPDDIGEDHPLRAMLDFAEAPILAGPDDKGLLFPKKGAVFMNGRVLEAPKARAEVPNLIQVADKSAEITISYWQDGAAFREEILGPTGTVAVAPKWFVEEDPSAVAGGATTLFGGDAVADEGEVASNEQSEPNEPSEPVAQPKPIDPSRGGGVRLPQLLAGAGLAIAGGSLYGVGYASRSGLADAATEAELVSTRSRVNLMVFGAGACAVAGLGVGVTAFVDADGGRLAWTTRF